MNWDGPGILQTAVIMDRFLDRLGIGIDSTKIELIENRIPIDLIENRQKKSNLA
jgi:hypothetical protein